MPQVSAAEATHDAYLGLRLGCAVKMKNIPPLRCRHLMYGDDLLATVGFRSFGFCFFGF